MSSVSVVVPAKDCADTVEETLRSILAEPEVAEAVVILAPSRDGTREIVDRSVCSRLRLVETEAANIACSVNLGLGHAAAPFVSKVDADDIVPPGRFAWQVRALSDRPDCVAVCGAMDTIDERGRLLGEFARDQAAGDVAPMLRSGRTPTHVGAFLCRAEAARSIGGFRPWFETSEDLDFSFRLAELGGVWFEPRPAYRYRLRAASVTHTQPDRRRIFFHDCARSFAEQRRSGRADDLARGAPPAPPQDVPRAAKAVDAQAAGHLEAAAWAAFAAGRRGAGLRAMARSLLLSPRLSRARGLAVMVLRTMRAGR